MSEGIKNYLLLTKPGILAGNLLSATAGFCLACRGHVESAALLPTLGGITLVVASACICNNCVDRNLDRQMSRTRSRALPQGVIRLKGALLYAALLGLAGTALLWATTNRLTVAVVVAGFAIYVGVYSLYLKRHSVYGALIGSLAGAAPPLAGYCAVTNRFDTGALILLLIFSLWQMPHCYAFAIFRLDDYTAAALPVLPVQRGTAVAKKHILGYTLAFAAATLLPTVAGYTGYAYLGTAAVLGLGGMVMAWSGYRAANERLWAKRLFVFSLVTIFTLSIMMALDLTPPSHGLRPAALTAAGTAHSPLFK